MQAQSLRHTFVISLFATAIWAGVVSMTADIEPVGLLLQFPFFFALIFFTMRITNRITAGLGRRFGLQRDEANRETPRPAEPSSERPEHAQRRRERRRRRGSRRRRGER